MNRPIHFQCILLALLTSQGANGAPTEFPDGISIANTNFLTPWPMGSRTSIEFGSFNGGMALYSPFSESTDWGMDGGIYLWGNPIRMVLGAWDDPNPSSTLDGSFEIWRSASAGLSSADPLFAVDSVGQTADFNGLDVSISGGSLRVGGSLAVTAANASSLGIVTGTGSPPTTSAWTNVYISRGAVTGGGILEFGSGANAHGLNSVAIGTNANASGANAFAFGEGASAALNGAAFGLDSSAGQQAFAVTSGNASGFRSFAAGGGSAKGSWSIALGTSTVENSGGGSVALGNNNITSGSNSVVLGRANVVESGSSDAVAIGLGNTIGAFQSYAIGLGGKTSFSYETTLGMFNRVADPEDPAWQGWMSPLLRVGNGTSNSNRGDALTIRRNGQTTIKNIYWSAVSPLAISPQAQSNQGEALVIEGHTRLRGRVIIEKAQGDIPMFGE